MKEIKLIISILFLSLHLFGQNKSVDSLQLDKKDKFNYKSLILPSLLIGYGVVGLESHALKGLNSSTKNEIAEHIDNKFTIDDFSQYSPFIAVYAMNVVNIKGKNNLKDRTIILGTSYLIMGATVNIIKKTGNTERPDGSASNSFPSGHTATAFMGAEFLFQEYKDVSIWYGISGYAVASGTGFFRMYNNRHWLSDVAAGAGIGIFSTKIAYWIHPLAKKSLFKKHKNIDGMIMPFYNSKTYGLGAFMTF
ncbi:phosphatase PAP2 family protein [Hymenobacter elongatus]|uniref:Phosphatase PAP2 family protein n=1 Tax=Hymenobacter elongatus TaxID=877208 RepID=A0A4Z0PM35_9BACT|nr:phosphatase PAP2 family protein [Hymenobacter elongatus]TGE15789.1 phosphatase PAP2 family protein [Hymenobacter elongatus]